MADIQKNIAAVSAAMLTAAQTIPTISVTAKAMYDANTVEYVSAGPTNPPTILPTAPPTPEPIPIGEQIVATAKQYLGVPYVWGGTTPDGFDCSGLVQYVYAQYGITLPRTSYTQANEGREVLRDELRAGDLVFFANDNGVHHVGIYTSNGQFIHAPQSGDVVKISNLSERDDYYGARRIIE